MKVGMFLDLTHCTVLSVVIQRNARSLIILLLALSGLGGWPADAAQLPVITAQPQSQTVDSGSMVTFAVTATSSTPLSYQWRHAGTDIPDATNASLQIVNAQSADTGYYVALVR